MSDIKCELQAVHASDLAVVNAARISFDDEHEKFNASDEKLIGYLLRNKHGSPFEHGYFKFRIEAPIFVFREHHRHRAGHSYNEMSGRYTELEEQFYYPDTFRRQVGKPGHYSYEPITDADQIDDANATLDCAYRTAWWSYKELLRLGVAKEQARAVLPLGIFSKMIWSCNPRSLMHFLGLRGAKDAQAEIQEVARAAEVALATYMPATYAAFCLNGRVAP